MSPLALLLLQMLVVVAVTRACARVLRGLGQPEVIGEVIGGIALGPSVLGALWPSAGAFLFPPASLSLLGALSQVGLVLFMFVIGLELDPELLRREARAAVVISYASIAAPFALGSALAWALYRELAPAGVPFLTFGLFIGVAMSITAFPVLARIVREKRLSRSPLGATALACAAVDDFTAWCALAVVSGIARRGGVADALGVILMCAAYVAAMLLVARPAAERWWSSRPAEELLGKGAVAAALAAMLASALAAEALGLHALFGAFLAGVIMPKHGEFRRGLTQRLEELSVTILLPLFFALSGLRTRIGLLGDARSWGLFAAVLSVAVAGKLGGAAAAARWVGKPWRQSLALGALMNARGLVELVALNVGYELGIVSPELFTMLVLMALVTTLMTGPLLELLIPEELRAAARGRINARGPQERT